MSIITLKDGSRTTDRRLDRIILIDDRSKQYPASRLLTATQQTPRTYTWDCPVSLDQGQEGSCVGHGIADELAARPVMIPGITHEYAVNLYYDAQRADPWPGGAYPGSSPHYDGTATISGIQVAMKRGFYTGYSWAFSEDELMLAIGWKGPVVLGITWFNDMYSPNANGFITPTGGVAGGHCILATGVSVRDGYYRLHNSWGPTYGIGGDCFITRANMKTLLAQNGEACIPEGRRQVTL